MYFKYKPNPLPLPRAECPEPVLDEKPEWIELYWQTWELAWNHVLHHEGAPQSPYMDEGVDPNTIWIWDTAFMALFCKYAPHVFPGIQSLDNFYRPMYDKVPTPQRIHHPDNPPLFAWTEYEHYRFTGDVRRITRIMREKCYLQRHYEFLENVRPGDSFHFDAGTVYLKRCPHGYTWSGNPSGMDNTPRGRGDYDGILWFDAMAQQALSALYIARLATEIDDVETARAFTSRHSALREQINTWYWDEEDGIYYDIRLDAPSRKVRVKTPAAYWPLLAELCDDVQAGRLAEHVAAPRTFGGDYPWASVARDDPDYEPQGMYWRGGIWLPTAYAGIKALEKYGYQNLADSTAWRLIDQMECTCREVEPHTVWECYHPEAAMPATGKRNAVFVRPDFCGWSALGPISLLIENVLGFRAADAVERRLVWDRRRSGRHGIRRLRFGDVVTDVISEGERINVTSTQAYTLVLNGRWFSVRPGTQVIDASA